MSESDSEQDLRNAGPFGFYKEEDETLPQATLRYFKTGNLFMVMIISKMIVLNLLKHGILLHVWIQKYGSNVIDVVIIITQIGTKYLKVDKLGKQLEHSNVDVSGELVLNAIRLKIL